MADLKPRIILLERVPPKLESFFFFSRPSSPFSFKRNYPLAFTCKICSCSQSYTNMFAKIQACSGHEWPGEPVCMIGKGEYWFGIIQNRF